MRGTNAVGSAVGASRPGATRRVLVPSDGSPAAAAALDHALREFPDAETVVLFVIDTDEPDGSLRQRLLSDAIEEQRRTGEETADRVLGEARRTGAGHGVEITMVSAFGRPTRKIVDYAEENGIDRIVMGTHGRSGLSRLLLGSVSEAVVQRSQIPVRVVHRGGGDGRSRPEWASTA
jgi:nucleotide-binding universal stress UspA family protein